MSKYTFSSFGVRNIVTFEIFRTYSSIYCRAEDLFRNIVVDEGGRVPPTYDIINLISSMI